MLAAAFRTGLATARAAGWRAYALALLSYVPPLVLRLAGYVFLLPVLLYLQVLVVFALIRLLGAHRAEPVPPPPQVDDQGRRVVGPPQPGPPLSADDARVRGALRNAARLARPGLRMTGLILLAELSSLLTVFALASGGDPDRYSERVLLAAVLPVSALFLAFIVLAPQRIALEGETRVLVATAHAVRIARTAYGVLLLLTIAEPLVSLLGSLPVPTERPPLDLAIGLGVATALVAAVLQVVTTAVANEIYLAGPRLDLPADPGPSA